MKIYTQYDIYIYYIILYTYYFPFTSLNEISDIPLGCIIPVIDFTPQQNPKKLTTKHPAFSA